MRTNTVMTIVSAILVQALPSRVVPNVPVIAGLSPSQEDYFCTDNIPSFNAVSMDANFGLKQNNFSLQ